MAATFILSPVLRMVSGDPFTPQANAAPMRADDVAAAFGCVRKYFLKIQDGDGKDGDGNDNSSKEGHAGHWIIKMTQPSQPKVYEAGKYSDMERVDIDPAKHSLLKRGYYIRVNIGAQDSGIDAQPGLFLNPGMIEIVRAGVEITSGPDAGAVFTGGGSTQSSAPQPPTPPAPPAPGGDILVATGKDGMTIAALQQAGWTDQQMIDAGYATKPAAPPPPPAPPKPPAPPHDAYMNVDPNGPPAGFKMLPAAGANTYKSMIDAGWTQDMLVQNGMVGPL